MTSLLSHRPTLLAAAGSSAHGSAALSSSLFSPTSTATTEDAASTATLYSGAARTLLATGEQVSLAYNAALKPNVVNIATFSNLFNDNSKNNGNEDSAIDSGSSSVNNAGLGNNDDSFFSASAAAFSLSCTNPTSISFNLPAATDANAGAAVAALVSGAYLHGSRRFRCSLSRLGAPRPFYRVITAVSIEPQSANATAARRVTLQTAPVDPADLFLSGSVALDTGAPSARDWANIAAHPAIAAARSSLSARADSVFGPLADSVAAALWGPAATAGQLDSMPEAEAAVRAQYADAFEFLPTSTSAQSSNPHAALARRRPHTRAPAAAAAAASGNANMATLALPPGVLLNTAFFGNNDGRVFALNDAFHMHYNLTTSATAPTTTAAAVRVRFYSHASTFDRGEGTFFGSLTVTVPTVTTTGDGTIRFTVTQSLLRSDKVYADICVFTNSSATGTPTVVLPAAENAGAVDKDLGLETVYTPCAAADTVVPVCSLDDPTCASANAPDKFLLFSESLDRFTLVDPAAGSVRAPNAAFSVRLRYHHDSALEDGEIRLMRFRLVALRDEERQEKSLNLPAGDATHEIAFASDDGSMYPFYIQIKYGCKKALGVVYSCSTWESPYFTIPRLFTPQWNYDATTKVRVIYCNDYLMNLGML